MFTVNEILTMKEPGDLFSDSKRIKEEYHKLTKYWHPDFNFNSKESQDVMAKVNELYFKGLDLIKNGSWKADGFIRLSGKDNKVYELKYNISHDFELGTMYIGNTVVLYLLDENNKDLYENAVKIIDNFTYADLGMKEEVSKYLPKIIGKFETKDNKLGIVIQKTSDLFLLNDVLDYFDGNIPEKHAAWILSSLYNLVCYLDYAKLSHNSISLKNYFVSPKCHSGALLGGWWYAVPQGEKMLGVTEETYSIMPPKVKNTKAGDISTDLESIRLIGRELLGDKNGTNLNSKIFIPIPMINWVRGVSSSKAVEDYENWMKCLYDSFGERKFTIMNLNDTQLYEKVKKF
ncbi:J domain-containing protein [Clostridium scatologenes]|uniref:J domain-containing protein n=1 Tax=Clostridium scatologenes TaxID=1548 RepID=A0A0E3JZ33_CLOSL|nr:J domain-containing protein [Clostridium scatologenes]AKA67927.1 hypothetical protein CSCA_0802 [Clostridium scatologenes]